MYRHILLPVDGSEPSGRAARRGIELARALAAKVTVVTVTTPWASQFARELAVVVPDVIVDEKAYERKAKAAAESLLATMREAATAAGVPCTALHVSHREPWLAIVDAAREQGCDLIVMGSHAPAGMGALWGSETARVITGSAVPVLVYREARA
jgi:nucleotide-binding universal stress UspA family protein